MMTMRIAGRMRSALAAVAGVALLLGGTAYQPSQAKAEDGWVAIVEPSFLPDSWGYNPGTVYLTVGDRAVFYNSGAAPHTVTAYSGAFDSGILLTGEGWSFTASAPGSYTYYCILHPQMQGLIVVQ